MIIILWCVIMICADLWSVIICIGICVIISLLAVRLFSLLFRGVTDV
jgi:hypothetical protein